MKTAMLDTDWITFRAHQSFPLADQASGKSLGGSQLPQSFLLDLFILMPSKLNQNIQGLFYISELNDLNSGFQLVINYKNGDIDIPCAICAGIPKTLTATSTIQSRTFLLAAIQHTQQQLQANPWLNKISGNVCAGFTKDYSGGSLQFTPQGAQIHASCIHYLGGDHLQAIQLDGRYMTGIVTLQAGEGIQFQFQGDNTIKVSIERGYLQQIASGSVSDYVINQGGSIGTPVRSINGILPDSSGNITLSAVDCVQLGGVQHGITINNPCAKPCCSTTDTSMTRLDTSIELLKEEHKLLRQYYINMSNVVNYMQANLSTLMAKK